MQPGALAAPMPDVRGASCGYSAAASPAGGAVHPEPCLTELVLPGCASGSRSDAQPGWGESCGHCACVSGAGSRLFRSMENLHSSAAPDAGVYTLGATCRSADSELLFRCAGSSEALNRLRAPLRRDLPPLPQWLFPMGDERTANGGTRRDVREKLRSQSARVSEPNRPLKPQGTVASAVTARGPRGTETTHTCPAGCCLACGPRLLSLRRIRNPEEIKQEVMRRLQLRRQRSSPNLAPPPAESPGGLQWDCRLERRRPPAGRLYIPTFEEFKRMKQKEGQRGTGWRDRGENGDGNAEVTKPGDTAQHVGSSDTEETQWAKDTSPRLKEERVLEEGGADGGTAPVCMSPAPRSLLQPQATGQEGAPEDPSESADSDASGHGVPWRRQSCQPSSGCCPSLLLDGTDLSSYGAKISRIRDGFIGSALDLIKKSCAAESAAEASVMLSLEREDDADIAAPQPSCRAAAVSIATLAGGTEMQDEPRGGRAPSTCLSRLGCRRSSLDTAREGGGSVRVQRSCRLRPHFSDPMPTDGARRKQLELKMAAAAGLQAQHRDRSTVASAAKSCSETNVGPEDVAKGGQHRWSNVSSLSADSGVVGLGDERDDDEGPRWHHPAPSEVERVDSGIGSGLTRHWGSSGPSLKAWEAQLPYPDCGQHDPALADGLCDRCVKLRKERKEAVLEFLNTEVSYGEDLRIIKEEFYCPMRDAGLLTTEQLAVIFGNVQELIDVNEKFTECLQDAVDRAFDQGDEDLLTVCIGEIFLEFVDMLPAFQTYCLQQSTSVNLLNTLEKEKELLRIFLDVSQNDNTALRRMNLRSFLMAPLQRVTKYPLLLNRIGRATADRHPDGGRLREAKRRVESHLQRINTKTKQEGAAWCLRSFRRDGRRTREVGTVEMREVSVKAVGWTRESTRFVMEGPLQLSQPADGQWTKKGSKALKFQNVQSLLMVRTKRAGDTTREGGPLGPDPPEAVCDGALVLIKDKSGGKFAVFREPIRLGNCVVSVDPDCDDTFELLDIPREAFVLRAADRSHTQQWFHQIRRYSCDLGPWRKRRNALPNIMMSTAHNRS